MRNLMRNTLFTLTCLGYAGLAPAADIENLMRQLEGSYRVNPAATADGSTPWLTSHFATVDAPALGDHVVYWQLNLGAEETLYRQRVLVFSRDDNNRITQSSLSLVNPAAFADGHRRPELFAALRPEDTLEELPAGCLHVWNRTESGGGWRGVMAPESCRFWSERKQAWTLIGSEIVASNDALLYVERGFSDDNEKLFGPPEGQYYRLPRSGAGDNPTAREIMERATTAAGGEAWRFAETNLMTGDATLYQGGRAIRADRYEMRRVYPTELPAAHTNTGKFRLDAYQGDTLLFTISFDGERMYSQNGPMPPEEAARLAASSFGFSAVRFALDESFSLQKLADDQVEGRPCWFVRLADPSGGYTLVGVDKENALIRYVGWQTPGGGHHRLYSDHYGLPSGFVQPGRVRLFYDGEKTTDINWTDAELGVEFADAEFRIVTPGDDG